MGGRNHPYVLQGAAFSIVTFTGVLDVARPHVVGPSGVGKHEVFEAVRFVDLCSVTTRVFERAACDFRPWPVCRFADGYIETLRPPGKESVRGLPDTMSASEGGRGS